jgi:hypothetical protein
MARPLFILAVLSLGPLASPASAQTPGGEGGGIAGLYDPGERPRMLRAAALTRAKLARPVNFGGIANPKTSLGDALALLNKQSGIPLEINNQAFKDEGVEDALRDLAGKKRTVQ